ncbi:MAG: gamma-glutamyltransferase [Rhodospirillales bacterium]
MNSKSNPGSQGSRKAGARREAKAEEGRGASAGRGVLGLAVRLLAIAALGIPAGCRSSPPPAEVAATPLGFSAPVAADAGPRGGIVAVSEANAAAAGARILSEGGNAVDAAAAIQFTLNVTEPQSSGIGGGGFALVYLAASGRTSVLDFRETAPQATTVETLAPERSFAIASTSGRAVGVPGTVRGIARALELWGTMPLARTLEPAIGLAEDGFEVGPSLARALTQGFADGGRLANEFGNPAYDAARGVFAPQGAAPTAGTWLRQPELARTLRLIGDYGAGALYDCGSPAAIAPAIVEAQHAAHVGDPNGGGLMTCTDLAAYEALLREPVVGGYRGYVIASVPPPSSGGIAILQMLGMVQRFPIGETGRPDADFGFGGYATLNVMQEVMRLAFADRAAFVGDPAFTPVPVAGLLAPDYLAARAATCPAGNAATSRYCVAVGKRLAGVVAGNPTAGTNTTHFTVADRFGNVVAWTGTIESAWGSGLMVPGFGFLLNNELTDFDHAGRRPADDAATGDGPNTIAAGKRPRSSIAPTIVFAATPAGLQPVAALGSPGGATIPNTVLAVLLNLIDFRMPVQRAIDVPRLSLTSPADGAVTTIEAGFDPEVISRLRSTCSSPAPNATAADAPPACYQFRETDAIGSVQSVVIDPGSGQSVGGADHRRDGTVIAVPPPSPPPSASVTRPR